MPREEQIRVPVAQDCGGSNFRVKSVGVKIFERPARKSDCEHKIDSVVEAILTAYCAQDLVRLFYLNLSAGKEGRDFCGSSPTGGMPRV